MAKIEIKVKKYLGLDMRVTHLFVVSEEHLEFFKDLVVRGAKDKNLEVEFTHEPF